MSMNLITVLSLIIIILSIISLFTDFGLIFSVINVIIAAAIFIKALKEYRSDKNDN